MDDWDDWEDEDQQKPGVRDADPEEWDDWEEDEEALKSEKQIQMQQQERQKNAEEQTYLRLRDYQQDLADESVSDGINQELSRRSFRDFMKYYRNDHLKGVSLAQHSINAELDRMDYQVIYRGNKTADKVQIAQIYEQTKSSEIWMLANQSLYGDIMSALHVFIVSSLCITIKNSESEFTIDLDACRLVSKTWFTLGSNDVTLAKFQAMVGISIINETLVQKISIPELKMVLEDSLRAVSRAIVSMQPIDYEEQQPVKKERPTSIFSSFVSTLGNVLKVESDIEEEEELKLYKKDNGPKDREEVNAEPQVVDISAFLGGDDGVSEEFNQADKAEEERALAELLELRRIEELDALDQTQKEKEESERQEKKEIEAREAELAAFDQAQEQEKNEKEGTREAELAALAAFDQAQEQEQKGIEVAREAELAAFDQAQEQEQKEKEDAREAKLAELAAFNEAQKEKEEERSRIEGERLATEKLTAEVKAKAQELELESARIAAEEKAKAEEDRAARIEAEEYAKTKAKELAAEKLAAEDKEKAEEEKEQQQEKEENTKDADELIPMRVRPQRRGRK